MLPSSRPPPGKLSARQLPLNRRRLPASRSAELLEQRGTTFWSCMLEVVKRAVLSQCWFHVSSPVICARAIATRALIPERFSIETRDIRIQQRREIHPRDGSVARQVHEQRFELILMSSDRIHA